MVESAAAKPVTKLSILIPVYNEAIADGKRIKIQNCKKMWGLGVPADLLKFLKNYVI